MKFIHTADLHLGKTFSIVGDRGKLIRDAQIITLERIVELGKSEAVDFLIIAGDLFESNSVSKRLVNKTVSILKRIDPIPILILPGTHDALDETSVYWRNEFRGSNIKVFGIDGTSIKIKNTMIHGRANDTKQGAVHPLMELKSDPDAKFNIAVVHASVEIEGKSNPEDYLISPDEIKASKMDYIAFGHWHRQSDFSVKGVNAWYSGAPEPTKFDEADKAGNILLVKLGQKITVDSRKVNQFTWFEKTIDVSTSPPGDLLNSEINELKGQDVLLRLKLKGILPIGHDLDADALEDEFSQSFFNFEIDTSKIGYPIKDVEQLFAKDTIGDLYISRLKELIKMAQNKEEKALLEEALYLGSSYISKDLEVE